MPAPLSPGSPLPSSSAAYPHCPVCSYSCSCADSKSFPTAQTEIHPFINKRTGPSFLDFVVFIPLEIEKVINVCLKRRK